MPSERRRWGPWATAGSVLSRYAASIRESARDRAHAFHANPAPIALPPGPLSALWLGHAGVLLRLHGTTILVDPVLSRRIGARFLGRTFGPERIGPPAIAPESLPPVDLILITHAHFDHLDRPTLERLASERTRVVTARRTGRLIPRGFGSVIELDRESSADAAGVAIEALRPAHRGARFGYDHHRGCNSYVVRVGDRRVLIAGDTGATDAFDAVGGADLAVFGISSYEPWARAHATPEQVWRMFRASGARRLLPVHHSTFRMGQEPMDEPMRRLLASAAPHHELVITPEPGRAWTEH